MQKFIFILIFVLSTGIFGAGHDTLAIKIKLSPALSVANCNFRWSVAGNLNGNSPNVFSELIWTNLVPAGLEFPIEWNFHRRFYLKCNTQAAFFTTGTATDTDYEGDNRTDTVFHTHADANKGSLLAFSPSVGIRFKLSKTLSIAPSAGFGINNQNLFLLDNGKTPVTKNLASTYKAYWYGPFISLETGLTFSKILTLSVTVGYHQVNYRAKANWNLIENFQHPLSFRHTAKGFGLENSVSLCYSKSKLRPYLKIGHMYWSTGNGTDELYLATGEVKKTRLNDVTYWGFNIAGAINFFF
ncbi:MAG: hypothetical protein JXB34_14430 [Bacteroidales bacterium]|nr:hypothetical protein [Bacteroidales bacterium]